MGKWNTNAQSVKEGSRVYMLCKVAKVMISQRKVGLYSPSSEKSKKNKSAQKVAWKLKNWSVCIYPLCQHLKYVELSHSGCCTFSPPLTVHANYNSHPVIIFSTEPVLFYWWFEQIQNGSNSC